MPGAPHAAGPAKPFYLRREFVFALSDSGQIPHISNQCMIGWRSMIRINVRQPVSIRDAAGRKCFSISAEVPSRDYYVLLGILGRMRPVESVDAYVVYYYDSDIESDPARVEFKGPIKFALNNDSTGRGYTLSPGLGEREGEIHLDINRPQRGYVNPNLTPAVIVYDTDGRSHEAYLFNKSVVSSSNRMTYKLEGVPVERIARVSYSEKLRWTTFNNIPILWPNRN